MTTCKWWLTLVGGFCLLVGLCAALLTNRYQIMKTLPVARGANRESLSANPRAWADFWFYVFVSLTALGVILQTLGALLSP